MGDFVKVAPSRENNAVSIAVNDPGDGKLYPIYNTGFGAEGSTPTYVSNQTPLPVHMIEKHYVVVNELFHNHTGVSSTVAVASVSGDTTITVANGAVFSVGDKVQINNGAVETTFPQITAISVNDITFDRPLDYAYSIGNVIEVIHVDLKTTAGSLVTPISHTLKPHAGEIWHIERILISINHAAQGTDDKFGSITALTNGVVLRANINGQFHTFTNWKNNRDIRLDMYDMEYTDKAGPTTFGTHARGSFNEVGIAIRLDGTTGDYLEVLVQDDLTTLGSFLINGQGHHELT